MPLLTLGAWWVQRRVHRRISRDEVPGRPYRCAASASRAARTRPASHCQKSSTTEASVPPAPAATQGRRSLFQQLLQGGHLEPRGHAPPGGRPDRSNKIRLRRPLWPPGAGRISHMAHQVAATPVRLCRTLYEKKRLVVEGRADVRKVIRIPLVREGSEINEAPGGINSLQVCRRIQADPAQKRTKVVMLAAHDQRTDRQAVAAGADHDLLKPFSPIALPEWVNRLLR